MPRSVRTDEQLERMPEEDLIIRAKRGSVPAIEHLLRKYRGLVKAKARTYFLLGADREDLIQEGMIGLFKAIRDFSSGGQCSFRTFAALCVMRQMISAVKGASRHKHGVLNTYVSMDGNGNEGEGDLSSRELMGGEQAHSPEVVVLRREFVSRISGAIDRSLSELEREVVRHYLKGSSYGEIARALGCKVKVVDNALQRAKKKLEQNVQLATLDA